MDSPQYTEDDKAFLKRLGCFKPYYKWIVLNTEKRQTQKLSLLRCFKPYYKWIVLNT